MGTREWAVGGLVALLAVSGCSRLTAEEVLPSTATGSSLSSPSATSAVPSAPGCTTPPSPSPTVTAAQGSTPASASTPAPSRTADLDGAAFPSRLGAWVPAPGEGDEGSYVPNGTFTHAIGIDTVMEGLAYQGCPAPANLPRPRAALGATYKNLAQGQGNGQVMSFADEATAKTFYDRYVAGVLTCTGSKEYFFTSKVVKTAPFLVNRREYHTDGSRWLEMAQLQGTRVRLFLLAERTPLSDPEVAELERAIS